jgi:hypothetical protein
MQTINHIDYQYTGESVVNIPHGYGTFLFKNKHRYVGRISFGLFHKYGTYIFDSSYYQGFFSRGQFHGLGTYEDNRNIYKGSWKNGKKHGAFKRTDKLTETSYDQRYKNDQLIVENICDFIPINKLKTTEEKTQNIPMGKCIICYALDKDSCSSCGHIVCCSVCLPMCNLCPLCRAPIDKITRVYYS